MIAFPGTESVDCVFRYRVAVTWMSLERHSSSTANLVSVIRRMASVYVNMSYHNACQSSITPAQRHLTNSTLGFVVLNQ